MIWLSERPITWLSELIKRVKGADAIDFVVTPALPFDGEKVAAEPITADESYLELRIASLRIPRWRKMASAFYGVVHVFSKLARTGSKDIEIATILEIGRAHV